MPPIRAFRTRVAAVLSVAVVLATTACSQTTELSPSPGPGGQSSADGATFAQFPDLPTPAGAKMDLERTFVLGGNEGWFGQVVVDTGEPPNAVFDFYKRQLPQYGWEEVTSVRAPTSVLTYLRERRVLAIQITESTLRGSEVTLTVSPREQGGGATSTGYGSPGTVSTQTLP